MKNLLYILLLTSYCLSAQGLKFSSEESLKEIDIYTFEEKGYAKNLPYSYSLEKYVPPVSQQEGGSCVGFSAFYYGLSMMYNIEYNITSYTDKLAYSFDPYYIYTIINNGKMKCDDGLYMNEAMGAISKVGCKKMFYPKFLSCNSSWSKDAFIKTIPYSQPYKISNYYRLRIEDPNYIKNVKEVLYYDIPVIVGVGVTESLSSSIYNDDATGVSSDGLWDPNRSEEIIGGHAMCVVAYDDYKFGGSFRLVNSWGDDFGDNGFVWVKYSDFQEFVKEAYFMEIQKLENMDKYGKFSFTSPKYKGHNYEGQTSDGYMHGYGIYSFGNKSYMIGNFNNGSRDGWFIIIDEKNDEYITMIKYENNSPVDYKSLGFSELKKNNEFLEIKNYIEKVMPNKKVIILNEEPDKLVAEKLE